MMDYSFLTWKNIWHNNNCAHALHVLQSRTQIHYKYMKKVFTYICTYPFSKCMMPDQKGKVSLVHILCHCVLDHSESTMYILM